MADPIARDHLAGATMDVVLGGKGYAVTPLGPGDFAALERHLRQERYAMHCACRDAMPTDEYERRARQLLSLPFAPEDLQRQISEGHALEFLLERSVRKSAPDFVLAECSASTDEWKAAVAALLGISTLAGGPEEPDPTPAALPATPT